MTLLISDNFTGVSGSSAIGHVPNTGALLRPVGWTPLEPLLISTAGDLYGSGGTTAQAYYDTPLAAPCTIEWDYIAYNGSPSNAPGIFLTSTPKLKTADKIRTLIRHYSGNINSYNENGGSSPSGGDVGLAIGGAGTFHMKVHIPLTGDLEVYKPGSITPDLLVAGSEFDRTGFYLGVEMTLAAGDASQLHMDNLTANGSAGTPAPFLLNLAAVGDSFIQGDGSSVGNHISDKLVAQLTAGLSGWDIISNVGGHSSKTTDEIAGFYESEVQPWYHPAADLNVLYKSGGTNQLAQNLSADASASSQNVITAEEAYYDLIKPDGWWMVDNTIIRRANPGLNVSQFDAALAILNPLLLSGAGGGVSDVTADPASLAVFADPNDPVNLDEYHTHPTDATTGDYAAPGAALIIAKANEVAGVEPEPEPEPTPEPSERPILESATIEADGRTLTAETDIPTIGGVIYLTRTGDRNKIRLRVPLMGGSGTTVRTGQIPLPVYVGQVYTYEYDPQNGDLRPVGAALNNNDLEPLPFANRAVTNESEITVPPVIEYGSGNDAYPSWLAVTPDDDEDLPATQPRAIGVAVSGAVVAVDKSGNTATHYVTAGVPLRISPSRIKATGTTATGIVAYY